MILFHLYRVQVLSDVVARVPVSTAQYKDCLVLNLSYSTMDLKVM